MKFNHTIMSYMPHIISSSSMTCIFLELCFFVIYELIIHLFYYDCNVNLSLFFFYSEPDPRFLKWIRLDPDSQHCKNLCLQYMTPRSGSPIPFDESHVNIFIWFRAHVGPVRSLVAVNKFLVSGDNAWIIPPNPSPLSHGVLV